MVFRFGQDFRDSANEREYPDFHTHNSEYYNIPFTMKELRHALQHTKNSSPGEDTIFAEMVKKLPSNAQEALLKIYNGIWEADVLPPSWKTSVIIPIAKPGKDPKLRSSYRPIALTSVLCKIFERMVNFRLVYHMESHALISPCQYGFRRNLSTLDPLLKLTTYIQNGFLQGKHTIAVFFDLEKAYDTTWRKGVLWEMDTLGFKGNLPNFIKNFLLDRQLKVKVGSVFSTVKEQREGVPQGSVLSVMLFLIYINSLVDYIQIKHPSIQCSLFADDFALYFSAINLDAAVQKVQDAVNLASHWASIHGFKFSTSKTVAVHFCKTTPRVNAPQNITMNGQIITYEPFVKFLGLYFDSHLTWNHHIRQLKINTQKSMNILKVVSGYTWGADQTSLLKLYNALCKSKLNYACQIYSSASKSTLRSLDVVHNKALGICTGAYRTSPVESLYIDSGFPPLSIRREELGLRYVLSFDITIKC